jgi:type II secretory pathway pseudopilin PulG
MQKKNTQRGLTLIETIVYVAILAAMLAVVINTLLLVGSSYRELRAQRIITSSIRDSFERITREARNALEIDQVNSTFGLSPGNIVLNTLDESKNPTTIEFYVENETLKLREGGTYQGDLILGGVMVNNLVFTYIDTLSSEAIRVEMTLVATSSKNSTISENYSVTTVLRGSYE